MNSASERQSGEHRPKADSSATSARSLSERPFIQRRPRDSFPAIAVPDSVVRTLAASGQPLDSSTRDFMESRLGHDFSRVRIHTDAQADESAHAIQAHAYTSGCNIAFASGKFATETVAGRHLLAHELAHTVQQGNLPAPSAQLSLDSAIESPLEKEADGVADLVLPPHLASPSIAPTKLSAASTVHVARQKVAGYETKPIAFERADIEKLVGVSYWEQKITGKYQVTFVAPVTDRFKTDTEERDAVLSVLWQRRPSAALKVEEVITVSIPARSGSPKSQALLYQFTFQPKAKDAAKGTLESVKVEFKAAGAQSVVSVAPTPPPDYVAPDLSRGATDFPDGIDDYLAKYPEEKKQLYLWIGSVPGPSFNQIVTTSTPLPAGKKHQTNYRVTGTKPSVGKPTVEITYLGETPIAVENPAAGYSAKDFADISLDEQQAKPAPDKLGTLSGLAAVPADEVLSVKYTIGQYFAGGTRNKEVDVIVPIAKKATSVLYTLRFLPTTNDVEIQRVGESGSSVALTTTALNITRVSGFAENSADPAVFKAWISKRYPSVTLTGATLVELQASANQALTAHAGTPAWFTANYGIEILDATAAEARLTSVHHQASAQTAGLKSFNADDLQRLEFSLEAMGDSALKTVRGTRMVRQETHLEISGKPPVVTPDPKTAGLTLQQGSEKTILIYDTATGNDAHLFIGGTAGVRPSSVGTYVHEFGHVLELQGKLAAPFAAFVKAQGIAPLTWYAKSKPVTESFPEAFFVFQSDPEWMRSNLPTLFTWLDAVNRTGAPPKP